MVNLFNKDKKILVRYLLSLAGVVLFASIIVDSDQSDKARGRINYNSVVAGESSKIFDQESLSEVRLRPSLKFSHTPSPSLSAKAYLIYDIDSQKILTTLNADDPLPIASLTKLATALLVSKVLSPDDKIEITSNMVSQLPSPNLGLVPGEVVTVRSLVEGMLVGSANDAAEALIYAIGGGDREEGIASLNAQAESLNLKRTHYANPTGFDDPNAFSTAADVLAVALEIKRNPWLMSVLSETRGEVTSSDGSVVHKFQTTSSLLRDRDDIIKGGKTGFTDEALGNLVVFAGSPTNSNLLAVLLGSADREGEMLALIQWTFDAYNW